MKLLASVNPSEDSGEVLFHWLSHYRREGISQFHLLVHGGESSDLINGLLGASDIVRCDLSGVGSEVERVGIYTDYKASKLGTERMVFAVDADEFISGCSSLYDEACRGDWDYLTGRLVDRFAIDGVTPVPVLDRELAPQFPLCSYFTQTMLGALTSKVFLSRPGVRYGVGLHRALDAESLRTPPWSAHVSHLKWTSGIVPKIRGRVSRFEAGDPFLSRTYIEECKAFLEDFVLSDRQLNLSDVTCWYQSNF